MGHKRTLLNQPIGLMAILVVGVLALVAVPGWYQIGQNRARSQPEATCPEVGYHSREGQDVRTSIEIEFIVDDQLAANSVALVKPDTVQKIEEARLGNWTDLRSSGLQRLAIELEDNSEVQSFNFVPLESASSVWQLVVVPFPIYGDRPSMDLKNPAYSARQYGIYDTVMATLENCAPRVASMEGLDRLRASQPMAGFVDDSYEPTCPSDISGFNGGLQLDFDTDGLRFVARKGVKFTSEGATYWETDKWSELRTAKLRQFVNDFAVFAFPRRVEQISIFPLWSGRQRVMVFFVEGLSRSDRSQLNEEMLKFFGCLEPI